MGRTTRLSRDDLRSLLLDNRDLIDGLFSDKKNSSAERGRDQSRSNDLVRVIVAPTKLKHSRTEQGKDPGYRKIMVRKSYLLNHLQMSPFTPKQLKGKTCLGILIFHLIMNDLIFCACLISHPQRQLMMLILLQITETEIKTEG